MTDLKFQVKNLGVIKAGEFVQKPLTLFCGPNNSGKTWVMYSLYHYHGFMAELIHQRRRDKVLKQSLAKFNVPKHLCSDRLRRFAGFRIEEEKTYLGKLLQ